MKPVPAQLLEAVKDERVGTGLDLELEIFSPMTMHVNIVIMGVGKKGSLRVPY
jgi:hypothetical protein